MKANELRLNNYILEDGQVVLLSTNYDLFKCLVNVNRGIGFEPIPLTEEWLLKFGFKQQGNRKMWIKDRLCVVYESYFDLSNKPIPAAFYIGFKDLGNVVFHTTLKVDYVHTLQNAFFLTGEELTIK